MEFLLLHALPSHNAHSNINPNTRTHVDTHTHWMPYYSSYIQFFFFLVVFYLKHRISVISAVGDACKAEYRTLDGRSGQHCIDFLIIFLPNWWQKEQLLNVSIFSAFLISSRLIALRFIYVTILKSEKPKSMTKIRFLTYRIEGTPTWSRQSEREW